MASVTLGAVWVSLAASPATSLQLQATSIVESPGVTGGVRPYAGGRRRAVTSAGTNRSLAMTFTLVPNADAATLASWAGLLLLVRDPFGLKMYGTHYGLGRTQEIFPALSTVTVTVTETTFSEAV